MPPGRPWAGALRRARSEGSDDLREDTRVRGDRVEPSLRALGGLVRVSARRLGPVHSRVAVAVEQVVDDLEEQAELVAERPPGRLLALRHLRDPERNAHRGGEERAQTRLDAISADTSVLTEIVASLAARTA